MKYANGGTTDDGTGDTVSIIPESGGFIVGQEGNNEAFLWTDSPATVKR